MSKLVLLLVLALLAWKLVTGRWPWQPKPQRVGSARRKQAQLLLGVAPDADRQEILEAHRGSSELVHEANAARDTLLATLPVPLQK